MAISRGVRGLSAAPFINTMLLRTLQVLNAGHLSAAAATSDGICRVNARTRFKLYQLQFYSNSPRLIAAFVQLFIWLRIKMPLHD